MTLPFTIEQFAEVFRAYNESIWPAQWNAATAVGLLLITYALVVYPLIGRAIGHRYPAAPTCGVPCPTTIFTLGLFLLAAPALPRMLLIIPVAWAVVGLSAVLQLGMWEAWGLPVAAIAAVVFSIRHDFRHGRAARHGYAGIGGSSTISSQ